MVNLFNVVESGVGALAVSKVNDRLDLYPERDAKKKVKRSILGSLFDPVNPFVLMGKAMQRRNR